jgi:hypothetical protein
MRIILPPLPYRTVLLVRAVFALYSNTYRQFEKDILQNGRFLEVLEPIRQKDLFFNKSHVSNLGI